MLNHSKQTNKQTNLYPSKLTPPCLLIFPTLGFRSVQFSSVTQSCPTIWDPVNRSTPGLPVHHQLPEFTQTHVHWVGDAIQPSDKDLKVRPETVKLLQENWGNRLSHWSQQYIFGSVSSGKCNNSKNKQRLQQTRKFLHSVGNQQQNRKATYRLGENICKYSLWWGSNI